VGLNTRFQWNKLEGSPQTYTFTAHTSLFNNKIGGGILILRDQLGVTENTELHATYSYKIQSNKNTFAFGLRTSIISFKYNYNQLTLRYLDDPNFLPVAENATKPNFGTGFIYTGHNIFIGMSIPRILNTEFDDGVTSSTRYKRHFYLMGSYMFDIDNNISLKPAILLKGVEGGAKSLDITLSAFLEELVWLGFYTRDFSTYGFIGQIEFNNAYRLGYSFELFSKSQIPYNYTTHEVSLILDFSIFNFHRLPDKINQINFRDLFR
jgi:type IX secretion system PorP/SprF family membrane protein